MSGSQRPNVLFLLADELRAPTSYDLKQKDLMLWMQTHLKAQEEMRRTGVSFSQHYIASSACVPSRAALYTGQYSTLTGVSQTDGAAKTAYDPDMLWLDPNTVPTLCAYLKEAGYQTFWQGKWHVSAPDILEPGTKTGLPSYNSLGQPDLYRTQLYQEANRLGAFGARDWIGREPHGADPRDSGSSAAVGLSGRDVVYANQVVKLLHDLSPNCKQKQQKQEKQDKTKRPWFLACSLVNPHDIVLYGELSKQLPQYNFEIDPSVPNVLPAPTAQEDLSTKPRCQADYRDKYQVAFQPTRDTLEYRRLYYSLQLHMNKQMCKVLDALKETQQDSETLVIFTSDHGDCLGAHGLFQKWYSAYQEVVHVPLYIRLPVFGSCKDCLYEKQQDKKPKRSDIPFLTSHLDLVPTILGLCGFDSGEVKALRQQLSLSHNKAEPLPGRDLSPLIYAAEVGQDVSRLFPSMWDQPVLFMTSDAVFTGPNNVGWNGQRYLPVIQPSSIQTLILFHEKQLYKLSRYYNESKNENENQGKGKRQVEYEFYNITRDPIEACNLAHCSQAESGDQKLFSVLQFLLDQEIKRKCLTATAKDKPTGEQSHRPVLTS